MRNRTEWTPAAEEVPAEAGEDAVEEPGTAETVISEPESSVEEPDKEQ